MSNSSNESNPLPRILAERRAWDFNTYKDRKRITADAGIETEALAGGYSYRQILELVQNGADAIADAGAKGASNAAPARIEVRLEQNRLCVANTGAPLSEDGLVALLTSHNSPKRGAQIGRFGLGFKSLLKLGGRILFFSRGNGGAIEFNPQKCRAEISREFGEPEENCPGLRLAWPLDTSTARHAPLFFDGTSLRHALPLDTSAADATGDATAIFENDFAWAETLICAEFSGENAASLHDQLQKELADFRAEFLLFFGHACEIFLDDAGGKPRRISVEKNGDRATLHENETATEWLLVKRDVTITDTEAKADAKEIHYRESVPLLWAFPLDSKRAEAGHFWAFFPTPTDTKIAGILNAPWKLNSDRTAPVPGPWNTALMREAAKLIADTLPRLRSTEDPARPLDAFPRQHLREDIAAPLVEALWEELKTREVIPDGSGKLCRADTLDFPPVQEMSLLQKWQKFANANAIEKYTHSSCFGAQGRAARLREIFRKLNKPECAWFDAKDANRAWSAKDQHSTFNKAVKTWLEKLAPTDAESAKNAISTAKDALSEIGHDTEKTLKKTLAIFPTQDASCLTANDVVLATGNRGVRKAILAELLVDEKITDILANYFDIPRDEDSRLQMELLEKYFASATNAAATVDDWKKFWQCLRATALETARPFFQQNESKIKFQRRDGRWCPSTQILLPGDFEVTENDENAGLLLDAGFQTANGGFLKFLDLSTGKLEKFSHDYATIHLPSKSPVLGELRGAAKIKATNFFLNLFREKIAAANGKTKDEIEDSWRRYSQNQFLGMCFCYRPSNLHKPRYQTHPLWELLKKDGDLSQTSVTSVPSTFETAKDTQPDAFLVHADVKKFLCEAGAIALGSIIAPEFDELEREADLLDEFPELEKLFGEDDTVFLRSCFVKNLSLKIGDTRQEIPCNFDKKYARLLIDSDTLNALLPHEKYTALISAIVKGGWLSGDTAELVKKVHDENVNKRRAAVCEKAKVSLAEGLVDALENDRAPLAKALSGALADSLLQEMEPLRLAEIALSQLGVATLNKLADALEKHGLNPPQRWGGDVAREFVEAIGFPPEYATASGRKRAAEEFVSGPFILPPLHDFQEEVHANLEELIKRHHSRRRAIVSLPTGGGKTRVTVEAAVKFVLKPESKNRNVIWVAQTDELCEQAVQAFRQVWVNFGATGVDLRIARLWGGQRTPEIHDTSKPLVIVTSIDTLRNRLGEKLEAIHEPGLLIFDECHHAIAKSYTGILRWFDADDRSRWETAEQRAARREPAIIGLSATPFRGNIEYDSEETKRLAQRFDTVLFPTAQEHLYEKLLEQRVLARIVSSEIESEASLNSEELLKIAEIIREKGGEKEANFAIDNLFSKIIDVRLALDEKRNQKIIEAVKKAPERQILLYANSVRHARNLAAQLTLAGIAAAPLDGETPYAARRDFLEKFKDHAIRVLVNHSVLKAGFDAPKTDMILISRNIFSPVTYMQIVGRGLRGPENGGTDTCRIVTVKDNLGRYGERRAYHYFQKYYAPFSEGAAPPPASPETAAVF
ncbi:MAG: DEAD/DEAH box helicase family protein [Puniceicoccales bacterium]|jgi:superfamily II DNA or RNA helicase|nr:DEAD/DEAH box helicase family protein [Puniceicoccales bacterium]